MHVYNQLLYYPDYHFVIVVVFCSEVVTQRNKEGNSEVQPPFASEGFWFPPRDVLRGVYAVSVLLRPPSGLIRSGRTNW